MCVGVCTGCNMGNITNLIKYIRNQEANLTPLLLNNLTPLSLNNRHTRTTYQFLWCLCSNAGQPFQAV